MIRKNGIPLPNHLSTFFKHILSKMLNYNHQARFDCLQIFKELENYQASLQLYHSQATQLPSNQFNESVPNNDFFNLRSGRNNPVFKSAMMGQSPQLLPNAIQANIIVHEVPTNIPP
jgi:serine/threonine protein kinase